MSSAPYAGTIYGKRKTRNLIPFTLKFILYVLGYTLIVIIPGLVIVGVLLYSFLANGLI